MMDDLISRQAAIDAFLAELVKRERKNLLHTWSTVEVKYFITEMLEQLSSAQPEFDEWCTDCKEYDHERHCCPRYNRVIREAVNEVSQQWIPVTERLPEEKINENTSDFEYVLCTTTFGDVRPYKFGQPIGWSEPHFWHWNSMMDKYVVAWCELPEPWKGET